MKHPIRACIAAGAAAIIAPAAVQADEQADVEAVVQAVYDVISGPVGQARDFEAMRELYLPGAAMGAVSPGENGQGQGRVITLDDYIERSGPWLVENGFTERPTRTETTIYGELAYVRSAYEGVNGRTGKVFVTGVNFITLFKIDGDWKIASILWRSADEDWPVEAAFD